MELSRKLKFALLSGCMLFSIGTIAAQDDKKKAAPPPPLVEVSKVVAVKEGYSRKYPAQMVSVRDVALPARVSGKIEYIIRKCADCNSVFQLGDTVCKKCGKGKIEDGITMEGQFVKKGDLLIKLEDTTYRAARDAAKAQVEQAKAQIEQAKAQMEQAVAQAEQAKAQDLQANAQIEQANAQIEQANAQIKQAEASLKYAQDNYEREDNLRKVSAKKELDAAIRDRDQAIAVMAAAKGQLAAAKGQLASANAAKAQAKAAMSAANATKASADAAMSAAKAQLAAANATLIDAENNLSYTRILADFNGKIGKVAFSVGNYVTPSSGALAQLTQFDPIYVTFSISEQDYLTIYGSIENLTKDAVVRVRLSNTERSIYPEIAPVWIVDNKIDSKTGTIKIWARLNNDKLQLTPGGLVDALLSKKVEAEFPAIPVSSVQISRQGQFVWVVEADNSVRPQPVEAGSTLGNLRVITKGLSVGQTVVSAGAHKIIPIPGAKLMVTPVPRAAAK